MTVTGDNKWGVLRGRGGKGALAQSSWASPLWCSRHGDSMEAPQKLKNRTLLWSRSPLLGIYPKKRKTLIRKDARIPIFITVRPTTAKGIQHRQCPSTDDRKTHCVCVCMCVCVHPQTTGKHIMSVCVCVHPQTTGKHIVCVCARVCVRAHVCLVLPSSLQPHGL